MDARRLGVRMWEVDDPYPYETAQNRYHPLWREWAAMAEDVIERVQQHRQKDAERKARLAATRRK